MSVVRNLPVVRERKQAILSGDAALIAEQKKAGKLTARERIDALLDAGSFVELDVLNADAGVVAHTLDIIVELLHYIIEEIFIIPNADAGEHHILKQYESEFIAGIEKTVIGIVSATSNAYCVEVRVDTLL